MFHTEFSRLLELNNMADFTDADTAEKFARLYDLLQETNAHTNLTAIRDLPGIVVSHFVDSLMLCAFIPQRARILDVGCGGGFPSLPVAITRGDLHITSLDSTAKKLAFVAAVRDELGLNLDTLPGRAEVLAHASPYRESFNFVCARAVAELDVLAEICLPFVRVGGIFAAMKSGSGHEELAAARQKISLLGGKLLRVEEYVLRGLDEERARTLILVEKVAETPTKYPRSWAKIVAGK